jgi:DNA-binding beta-propeller fold protein YncE
MIRIDRMPPRVLKLTVFAALMAAAPSVGYAQNMNNDTPVTLGSTVPANGDVNPYGVARVPRSTGKLVEGQFLISNFNNAANQQGTGTTIVQVSENGAAHLFASIDASSVSCPGGIGLTTALVALRSGFVIVGSLPTSDGTSATAEAGCLLVLDSMGNVVETIAGHNINGPWDMTAVDEGDIFALFVTNVLNGTVAANGSVVNAGTVVRMFFAVPRSGPPELINTALIASQFPERTDPAALVIGPTGVAFDEVTGNLYVADSLDNRIAVIPDALFRLRDAGSGRTFSQGGSLNDPLGLTLNGHHLFTANGDDGNIIEFNTVNGKQVDIDLVDASGGPPPGSGALFGLWATNSGVYFVDDATNTFNFLR